MRCDFCRKEKATLFFKQMIDGEIHEVSLCRECATEHGFEMESPASLAEMLFGVDNEGEDRDLFAVKKKCKNCGMTSKQFAEESRFGCDRCYTVFEEELQPILSEVQDGYYHTGKTPDNRKSAQRLEWLKISLKNSIEKQNFEEAARLRDLIAVFGDKNGTEKQKKIG